MQMVLYLTPWYLYDTTNSLSLSGIHANATIWMENFEILQNTAGREFGFHDPSLMYLLKIRDELFPMVVARTLEHNANRFYATHSQPTDRGMIG